MSDLTVLQRAARDSGNPVQFYEDLIGVKDDHEHTPEPFRRFELRLELNEDDLDAAIAEVSEYVEGLDG